MDWTTGLTCFHIKHTGMLPKVLQELIVSIITLVLDFVSHVRLGCDDLYHVFLLLVGLLSMRTVCMSVQIIFKVHAASTLSLVPRLGTRLLVHYTIDAVGLSFNSIAILLIDLQSWIHSCQSLTELH